MTHSRTGVGRRPKDPRLRGEQFGPLFGLEQFRVRQLPDRARSAEDRREIVRVRRVEDGVDDSPDDARRNAVAAIAAGTPRDEGGCPRIDRAVSSRILDEWRHTLGLRGENFLNGWKTAALVFSVDLDVVARGGPLLGIWSTTSVRAAPPGHAPLHAGARIDRMGRALTANALLGLVDREEVSNRRKSEYNQAAREHWATFEADIAAALAIYDGIDGVCGNQWLAVQNAPPATRYQGLARLLADDRLWVNGVAKACKQYLAVEFDHVGDTHDDCGGRTPGYDAVDVFRSLLAAGHVSGVDDGVTADDCVHSDFSFPFLAAPGRPDSR